MTLARNDKHPRRNAPARTEDPRLVAAESVVEEPTAPSPPGGPEPAVRGNADAVVADDSERLQRLRSIWSSQLVLAFSVVVISIFILLLQPELFGLPTFAVGVAGVVLLTGVTLGTPWLRIAPSLVLVIPFGDIVCVGLMALASDVRLGFLWAFPVIWIAGHFSAVALGAALALIGAGLAGMALTQPSVADRAGLIVVLVTTTFIGITVYWAARQTRAFQLLLRRQAVRLRATSARAEAGERRTTDLLNAVDVGIARIRVSGQLRVVNDAYAKLYGIDRRDLARPAHSIDYDQEAGSPLPERWRPLARAARGEEFDDLRVWLFDDAGEWHALSVSSKRLESADDEGTEANMLLIVNDVTTMVRAQRERQHLAAMASHEMRHPLTAILGNAELSLDYDQLTTSTRGRLEVIYESSERLLSLLSDFLGSSPGPSRSVATSNFDLRTVLTGSIESFEVSAAVGDVTVVAALYEPLMVVGDAFRLRQVMDNLISNAIKYTKQGGQVTVRARTEHGRIITTITDTGIGMSATEVARVFDPYFRADAARDTASGTGLGMGISRELVQRQGGRLAVNSEFGVGTVVTVDLPAADEAD